MSVRPRRLRLLGGAAALTALAVLLTAAGAPAAPAPAPSTAPASASAGGTLSRFVVRLAPGADVTAVRAAVDALGGRLVGVQGALGTAVADLPPSVAQGLVALPEVRAVSPDREVQSLALGFDPTTQAGSMTNVTKVTGAQEMWKAGFTGQGADVALIDSGISPVPGLKDSTKVVVGPDLSFESQDPDLRHLDSYGHGTHMAGIIAGREGQKSTGTAYAADSGKNFYGMAPDARLVGVKVADHDGAVDVSQIIAAIDWVVQNQYNDGLQIRVLNLSFGTQSTQRWQDDPLSWAAEVAWHQGIAVVAAGGNDGATTAGLADPAYNPWIIAVGAADTKGTISTSDDTVAAFSARPAAGGRGVDVVAPGVGVIAPGVGGSGLYTSYPGARVGNGLLRGSGTSQAAAVVSGAIALLISQRAWWVNPDNLKKMLMATATPLPGQPASAQGAGEINLVAAMAMTPPDVRQHLAWGNGGGSLDMARAGTRITMDGVVLQGETDVFGVRWDSRQLAGLASTKQAWSWPGVFNGTEWIGGGFTSDTVSWAGKTWSGKTWSGKTWSGKTWSGKTWSGKTWSSAVWTGNGWSSASWPTVIDGDTALAAKRWASASWR